MMQRLGKPWYRRRALRIFRDDTSLSASPHLEPSLQAALGQSRFLILFASPEAAGSRWVSREVQFWLDNKNIDRLLIALTGGDLCWQDAAEDFAWSELTPLPSNLKGRFKSEPKWVDLRVFRDPAQSPDKLLSAAADLAAPISNIPKEDLLSEELIQQRRAQMLAWSAAACLLVFACTAAWEWRQAVLQRRQAVLQRDRAERNLLAAIDGTKKIILNDGVELRQTIGIPMKVVDQVLKTAGDLQDQLLKYNANSAVLRRGQAVALREQSQTLYREGNFSGALEAAQESRNLLRSISNAELSGPELLRELSLSENRIGEAFSKLGRHEEALQSFRSAIEIRKDLSSASPALDPKRDLAVAYERVADELVVLGRREEAISFDNKSLSIRIFLAKVEPSDPQRQEDLAVGYDHAARDSEGLDAIDWYDKSLAIRKQLVKSNPTQADWQAGLATILDAKGNALTIAGQCDNAIEPLLEGLDVRQSLADKNGDVPQYQANLAMSQYHLGLCGDKSKERFGRVIEILEKLQNAGSLPPNVRGLREVSQHLLAELDN